MKTMYVVLKFIVIVINHIVIVIKIHLFFSVLQHTKILSKMGYSKPDVKT